VSPEPSSANRKDSRQGGAPLPQEKETVNLDRRLAYLGLEASDAKRLQSMIPAFEDSGDAFVEDFYKHLFAFDETKQFLTDPVIVARLRELQKDHFKSLLEADWNNEYVDHRTKVGRAHAHVGLSPQWLLGAHSQYVQYCLRNLAAEQGSEFDGVTERFLSLIKVIFLDVGLTLDAYFEQSTEELRQALELYWKANDELRRFAQLASHDLKTPIATVANLCDETLDEFGDEMPEGARDLIRSARDRVFKTSTMIDELLESTLRAHTEESYSRVELKSVFADSLDRLKFKLEEKKIQVSLPDNLPDIQGDKARLREAFYNLLSNAVKFIDKDPGHIDIAVEESEGRCLLTIQDNGPGIPEAELQRIFAPFHRLTEHRERPGTGLGLYFTKYLIDRDGGKIWAESEPGKWSRFCVILNRVADS